MKVVTAEPLEMWEWAMLTDKKGILDLNGWKCRVMNASPGQEIEVHLTYYDPSNKLAWGLREVKNKEYQYLAMRIE